MMEKLQKESTLKKCSYHHNRNLVDLGLRKYKIDKKKGKFSLKLQFKFKLQYQFKLLFQLYLLLLKRGEDGQRIRGS